MHGSGLPELIVILYLVAIVFWVLGIVEAIRIKRGKALYILFAVLSLPVLALLTREIIYFLMKTQLIQTIEVSVIVSAISTVIVCLLQILIFFYLRKIKQRTVSETEKT